MATSQQKMNRSQNLHFGWSQPLFLDLNVEADWLQEQLWLDSANVQELGSLFLCFALTPISSEVSLAFLVPSYCSAQTVFSIALPAPV